jgi:hypothetical protein
MAVAGPGPLARGALSDLPNVALGRETLRREK